jgi:alpha-ketoglutaric semialdehyde dehydrogenase
VATGEGVGGAGVKKGYECRSWKKDKHLFLNRIFKSRGIQFEVRPHGSEDPCLEDCPALVEGNTVIFKPSSTTPLTAARLVEIFERAGLPPGVLNLLVGSSSEVGEVITHDPRVRAVSFTGSSENGSQIYSSCAMRGAKAQCEMGGKNPVVVLEDADLSLAVDGIVSGAFGSTGQRCTATSRAVLQESIADEVIARMAERVSKWKLGNGLDPDVQMGPLVSAQQLKTVEDYIHSGNHEGAKLVTGGTPGIRTPEGVFHRAYDF